MKKLNMPETRFVMVPPEDETYIAYRFRHLLFFIPTHLQGAAERRMMLAKKSGFGSGTQLLYLSTYAIDTKKFELVKNRYPDSTLPRVIFDSLFSGIIPDVIEL